MNPFLWNGFYPVSVFVKNRPINKLLGLSMWLYNKNELLNDADLTPRIGERACNVN